MSLEYIRKTYSVPAEVGRGVVCSGLSGVIVGHNGPHIEVLLDKDKPGKTGYYHPTWEVEYGEMKPIRHRTARMTQQLLRRWSRPTGAHEA